MGFRFRRRITIGPGFRLNLSKSGVSASVGTRGAWFTIGHGKTRETAGLPGTGLSYTEQQNTHAAAADEPRGRSPESPATPAADSTLAPSSTAGSRALVWLAVLALVVVAIAAWRVVVIALWR
jgi:uncharacterized protein DUF4236